MKAIFYIVTMILFISCSRELASRNKINQQAGDTVFTAKKETQVIDYSDSELENFLDSVGALSSSQLVGNVGSKANSVFKNRKQVNKEITASDFAILRKAVLEKEDFDRVIDIKTAKRIFGDTQIDTASWTTDKVSVSLFAFDKNKNDFCEFAICLGSTESGQFGWSCDLFFFKKNKIIAKHNIEHHYGLELNHFIDSDGKTVIYYKENFGTGSGIWQFNFYFYKYDEGNLIPVLNVLENGNMQYGWGPRVYWLETFVTKTSPLTLKMVYYQKLTDTIGIEYHVIEDSTFVQYTWNKQLKVFTGNFQNSKISEAQILSYYLDDNEMLNINSYYSVFKQCLNDKNKRQPTLLYLNRVKNYYLKN